ncbi:carbon-nitrogen hydrolase family protein [Rhodobacteraceae bacterium 2CG4]|uniref:Carbon-nitrogen hydrolase family protein n=1 Tax=Halovulum marinum TaxID=2662447 RepID=A0A6L5YYX9_9RHOB|nr:carbon-nitrogen hydrolase family protein [Halovulum marinum]MSU89418.1 carbon-nitrogen hydrolase family protein [Halovulum marinum]
MRAGLVQLTSSDEPTENLAAATATIRRAAADGARLVLTPEVTNCVSASRRRQNEVLRAEAEDPVLDGLRDLAAELGIHLLIGSLALKTEGARFANRSLLVAPDGAIAARYDKIHMFDVDLGGGEAYRESDGFRPGARAVTAALPGGPVLGLSICYDLRFAALYRTLAQAGAQVLTVPSAFTRPTGRAHWEPLLRARAIETGCYVLAPAQTGDHPARAGRSRSTWGHSMAVSPWGEVLLDMGDAPGAAVVDLDLDTVAEARRRIPSLAHDRPFRPPVSDD